MPPLCQAVCAYPPDAPPRTAFACPLDDSCKKRDDRGPMRHVTTTQPSQRRAAGLGSLSIVASSGLCSHSTASYASNAPHHRRHMVLREKRQESPPPVQEAVLLCWLPVRTPDVPTTLSTDLPMPAVPPFCEGTDHHVLQSLPFTPPCHSPRTRSFNAVTKTTL